MLAFLRIPAIRRLPGAMGLLLALAFALPAATARADGPGLGNLTYAAGELLATIARFEGTNGAPRGHGFVAMHRGYLLVPFSADGGGGNGTGGFAFYNVGNPRAPQLFFTTEGNAAYGAASPNYPGNLREPHGFSFTRFGGKDYVCFTSNITGTNTSGVQVWDFTEMNTPAPLRVSQLGLAGLNGGDYAPTPWWVFWQGGRYAYVAGTSAGLFIVDLSNPAVPVVVTSRTPSQLGFVSSGIHTAFAVGNLLVLTGSQPSEPATATGLATYDISDPANPVLLDYEADGAGYSAMMNGDRILGARDPARVWSIANPSAITLVGIGPDVATKGGYGTVQDGFFHYGSSSKYVKLNVSATPFTVAATNAPAGFVSPDWDFATPLGNLVFQGNDHSGSALVVHQIAPDTTAPAVNMVSPKANTVNRALTSRVGVTFTDQIDFRTVDATTFIVRPFGGTPLAGRYSHQSSIVNFWPDAPLAANTSYEARLPAGGVRDIAGNYLATEFVSYFSTGAAIAPLSVTAQTSGPVVPGVAASFTAAGIGPGSLVYSWNFGDGSAVTPFSANATASHAYAAPGHYAVTVTLGNGMNTATASLTQTVHRPLAPGVPASSTTILFDSATSRVWCVNPDADSVTAIDSAGLVKLFETPVGNHPRTIARAPGGAIWVANHDDATISVVHPSSGAVTGLIPLPRASRPFGLAFSPDGSAAWVATEGTGSLLKLDPASGAVLGSIVFGAPVRGIAITADSARVFVTRFLSPDSQGEIFEVNPATLALVRTLGLAPDAGPDTESSGRGVPNYLGGAAISPDGQRLWLPAKKDNIARGLVRDGLPLTFESSVRTVVAQIDLGTNSEPPGTRLDLNDRDMAQAAAFTPLGDYAFVAVQGSNSIDFLDAYSGARVGAVESIGRAPQGLVLNPAGTRLFAQNFMSRDVAVFDTSGFVSATATTAPPLATIPTVSVEPLSAAVLLGKQVFYNADDSRMNRDGYLSCASCHLDGGHDGRVWDFTDRGEGLRRTPSLAGRAGMAQGRVHWSANFDEIQDFEHDMRGPFGGDGFLTNAQFNTGTRNHPLGDAKAGLNAELDALAAYVASLATAPPSPFRQTNGALTLDAVAGRAHFIALGCFACHSGAAFTDSPRALFHDVGTITATSGQRLGGPLPGIDTPTLKGLWQAGRFLHDGSAATPLDVLTTANPTGAHGATQSINATQRAQLAAYLLQIDESETAPDLGGAITLLAPAHGGIATAGATIPISAAVSDTPGPLTRVEFFRNGTLLAQDFTAPFETQLLASAGTHTFSARAIFASGLVTNSDAATVTVSAPPGGAILVSATAPISTTGEHAAAPGAFRITRSGATTNALTVRAAIGGNATIGADFAAFAAVQAIPAGQSFVDLPVTAFADGVPEGIETVTLAILADPAYVPGASTSAAVTIADAPLDTWRHARFTAPERVTPAISADPADPNANGHVNLLEYALGRDPKSAGPLAAPAPGLDASGRLTLTFTRPRSATDITYFIEGTADFGGWLSDPAHVGVSLFDLPDGVTQSVTATWLDADPAAFFRLRVQHP